MKKGCQVKHWNLGHNKETFFTGNNLVENRTVWEGRRSRTEVWLYLFAGSRGFPALARASRPRWPCVCPGPRQRHPAVLGSLLGISSQCWCAFNDKKNNSVVFNLRPRAAVRSLKKKETSSSCKKNAGAFPECDPKIPGMAFSLGEGTALRLGRMLREAREKSAGVHLPLWLKDGRC